MKTTVLNLKDIFLDKVYITSKKRPVIPKSTAQKEYIDAIRNCDMVFGIGPAGTGKTYLAMAMAVAALSKKRRLTESFSQDPRWRRVKPSAFCPEISHKK